MIGAAQEKLPENPEQGSLNWVKKVLLQGGVDKGGADNPMTDVFAMAGRISNSSKYDEFIALHGNPYNKYLVNKDRETINKGFEELLNSLRYNFPLLTTEVKYTDRVYVRVASCCLVCIPGILVRDTNTPQQWPPGKIQGGIWACSSVMVTLHRQGVSLQFWENQDGNHANLAAGTRHLQTE